MEWPPGRCMLDLRPGISPVRPSRTGLPKETRITCSGPQIKWFVCLPVSIIASRPAALSRMIRARAEPFGACTVFKGLSRPGSTTHQFIAAAGASLVISLPALLIRADALWKARSCSPSPTSGCRRYCFSNSIISWMIWTASTLRS